MNRFILPMLVAFLISYFMTPVAKKIAVKVGAIDVPKDNRRVHTKPIPRMGGLAIYIAFTVCMFAFSELEFTKLLGIFIGSTLLVVMGMVDDVKPLRASLKLVIQLMAALILVKFGFKIDFLTNFFQDSGYIFFDKLSIPITIIWIIGITNTINLVDGLDGLATGIATIAALTLAYVAYSMGNVPVAVLTLMLAGSSLGFLPHNFNPASIFMGDTGAYFLGYILAAISIEGALKGTTAITVVIPVLALGLPIFDTTFAIIRRAISKKPIFEADKGHIHHRLLHIGYDQKGAVLILYLISILMGATAVSIINKDMIIMSILMVVTSLMIFIPIYRSLGLEKE
ncbi:MAG: undecaprenyl/decaprenyl-phosphate alpha-N-acetylglucosaminyl 1-phosphate transferase [Clostridia bacterium]|nr:undecaprenyl/decaprenyl-phosphate alpha-N-acetylglucosaminyl 1-phosphate transferase [Clostridia bacterium]